MTWVFLKPGDIVEVIAPGYGVAPEDLQKSLDYLRGLGLNPRAPDNLLGDDLLCANSDELRLTHLKQALLAEDSGIIWCLKGGYGAARLLPELAEMPKPPKRKLLVGFSDVTALHLFAATQWNWPGLHAPLLWQAVASKISDASARAVEEILFGKRRSFSYPIVPINGASKKIHSCGTSITGGNLSLVQHSIGTLWQVNAAEKILLLEDIDEAPYRIDRMLTHLSQAGIFDKAAAVLFGDFQAREEDAVKTEAVLKRFAASLPCPVFRISGVGHGPDNLPLPLHWPARLETGQASPRLDFAL